VVRSLGRAGVPVVALDADLNKPTAATRFGIKKRVRALSGPEFLEDLVRLRQEFSSDPVLFLTQEASVASVCEARDQLARCYRFSMPDAPLMRSLLHKASFQQLAESLGCPIPHAVRVHDTSDAGELKALRYPCIMKPAGKDPEYGKRFAKAYKVQSADEIARLWSAMRMVIREAIVQEWIEGSDSDVYFCLQYRPRDGSPAVSFVGRKVCQWPVLVGGTASCIPAPEAAGELTAITENFFRSIGFIGIGSMEYKRDSHDGKFYMVEPTVGRTDFQEEIASLNGVILPFAVYCGEMGIQIARATPYGNPRAWRDPFGYANARRAGAPDPIRELSPTVKVYDAYLRLDDPMPYIALKLGSVQRRLMGIVRPAPQAVV
jgi:predicted ATP-grasp superfamily ATP-dependent carboligase